MRGLRYTDKKKAISGKGEGRPVRAVEVNTRAVECRRVAALEGSRNTKLKIMEKDSVTITIKLDRNVNGTASISTNIKGKGFHYYEMIGLLQMAMFDMRNQSIESAKKMPKDRPVKLVFDEPEKPVIVPTNPK